MLLAAVNAGDVCVDDGTAENAELGAVIALGLADEPIRRPLALVDTALGFLDEFVVGNGGPVCHERIRSMRRARSLSLRSASQ